MLPKRNRLGRSYALRECIRRGRRIQYGGFLMKVLRAKAPCRFAIAISAKSEKLASKRNRMRRQLFGIIESEMPTFQGTWLVYITVLPQAFKQTTKQMRVSFITALQQAHL